MAKTIQIAGAGISEEKVNEMLSLALQQTREEMRLEILKAENPIGHVRIELTDINPVIYLGFGTWELWGVGQVPIGVDPSNSAISTANQSIGSNSVTVTSASTTPGATGKATGSTDATTPDNTGAYSGTTGAATGDTDSTTPGATGSTTPGNTGAATGSTGSTTPSATGAATGNTGSTAITIAQMPSHTHTIKSNDNTPTNTSVDYWNAHVDQGWCYGANRDLYSTSANPTGGGEGHTHTLNNHTHTSAAHSHTLNNHTHTSAAHTHTSAAHSHGLGSHTHSIPSHTHGSATHSHGLGSHTHTSAAHSHSVTISTVQSSVSCYMWRRVA